MANQDRSVMKRNWLAFIHVAKTQLNLTDDVYRDLLKERYGVSSARDLLPGQGKDLIDYFKSQGFTPITKKKTCTFCAPRPPRETIPTNTIYPASPQQLSKIKRLRDDIKWRTVDGFYGWLKRYFDIREIKTSVEASQVIYALLKLWRSQHKCRCSLVRDAG
jgi:hypothetical protein